MEEYVSFTLAYSRSRVFSFLDLQVTYWLNFGSVFLNGEMVEVTQDYDESARVCSL